MGRAGRDGPASPPTFAKVVGAFDDGYDLRLDALFESGLKALLDGLTPIVEVQEAVA